ncbi:MAG: phage adaptor protein [Planctomycetota bacterium]
MGIKLASEIINDAAGLYNDIAFDRIDEESGGSNAHNWLDFLNNGQTQLVIYRPQANVIYAVYQLIEGTKQRIPDGTNSYQDPSSNTLAEGIQIVEITRNMGAAGTTPGNAISLIEKPTMDLLIPGWHSETGVATVENYMIDERDPFTFWVTPPQPAASQGWIETAISCVPAEVSAKENAITLSDIYYPCLLDYMLYRAYLLDSDSSQIAAQKAAAHWNLFVTAIDRKDLVVKTISPKIRSDASPV